MEYRTLCLRAAKHLVAVWAILLFVITTLRAAEDANMFPKCKEEVDATDIEGLIEKNPCMFQCPPTVKMVCSNDGMSHMNDCFLCKSACNNPQNPIFKVCDGRCPCKGKPHDEDMETSEDCVDGACKTDAKDHYDEDYGYDVENPEAKYTSPVYTESATTDDILHESKGYEADWDGAEDEEELEEDEDDEEEDEDDDGFELEDGQEIDFGNLENVEIVVDE